MKTCKQCDKDISGMSSRAMFCSRTCKDKTYERKKHVTWEEYIEIKREAGMQQTEETRRRKEKEKESRIMRSVCKVCDSEFSTNQPHQVTCSLECRKRWKNRRNDKRINKHNTVDEDITLATLYQRDKGICYICGEQCVFEDFEYTEASFTCGRTYPTIDHIVPLARGGLHSWSNVKLAHHLCNSRKGDIVSKERFDNEKDLTGLRALIKPISSNKKRVKQYDKRGGFITEYESTVDAENATGIKQKGIQKCARGEAKSYGGFTWEY